MRESGLHAERTGMMIGTARGKAGRAGARRRGNRRSIVPLEKVQWEKAARGVACKVEIADRKTANQAIGGVPSIAAGAGLPAP